MKSNHPIQYRRHLLVFLLQAVIHQSTSSSSSSSSSSPSCRKSLHTDLLRRQSLYFSQKHPFTISDGTKHNPYLTLSSKNNDDGKKTIASITIGNGNEAGGIYHPAIASEDPSSVHFITDIYAVDQNEDVVMAQKMDPTEGSPVTVSFEVPEGTTTLTPFEFCNLHGLWMGASVNVMGGMKGGEKCVVVGIKDGSYASFHADFLRRQDLEFGRKEPFTVVDGTKHTPYLSISENGSHARLVVGNGDEEGGVYHPMIASDDPSSVHFITTIYILDQLGKVLTMKSLDPSKSEIASMSFQIPQGTTEMTAYEWCNLHGLWKGPTVKVHGGNVE